ncbi:PREDICTED: cytochrome c oxidase assembly factor 4 homolog, mitochondrial [Eufriesea mexicana]|uniref:cytochrome c oxidase assembly factor 4 homolog, mitochondrial n=1 Tax=Eufriesea mexicana TaxID=516756 RepID=UPI00083C20DD|nr:PREDICTED: cytochrome c oxidase assembly factor 4 homolog, mitochondrial [Eufriesea mexicana]
MISNLTMQQKDVEDPIEEMLIKTGCIKLHQQVQECIAETQDWRKCQEQVKKFKVCMNEYQRKREESYLNK